MEEPKMAWNLEGGRRIGIRVLALALVVVPALSGCLGEVDKFYDFETDSKYINPGVFPGKYLPAGRDGSQVLEPGFFPYGHPEIVRLRSATDGAFIPMAIWRPYTGIVEEGVPVIVDAGPYFEMAQDSNEDGKLDTIDIPQQRGNFYLQNMVPRGYAYAQVAVRGTGTHGGCMELMSNKEARDVSQAIRFLGRQPWSNGNVAMIGASYDGSTPWMVAAQGNEYLKAIVPVAGLPDIFDLMFHNGSAETRGGFMHDQVYWPFGFNYDNPVFPGTSHNREQYQERENLICPEMYEGAVMGRYSVFTADRGDPEHMDYWYERDYRPSILSNYKGSVFLIHGLQDWNVDPHSAIPFNEQLRAAGIPVKEWYGQWGHAYPDSQCQKEIPSWLWQPCRLDFAETLIRWFDQTLKNNTTVDAGPRIQVQDNYGFWRNADAFPSEKTKWVEFFPTNDGKLATEPGAQQEIILMPPLNGQPGNMVEFKTEVFEKDTRISGQIQLPLQFEAMGPGGFIGAWLWDEDANGQIHGRCVYVTPPGQPGNGRVVCRPALAAHGQMDLRVYEGGYETKTIKPGDRGKAMVEFDPAELLVPEGHRLTLWLFQWQYPDHMSSQLTSPVKILLGGSDASKMRLPTVDVDIYTIFPVPGSPFPTRDSFEKYSVPKPSFSYWFQQESSASRRYAESCEPAANIAPVGLGVKAMAPAMRPMPTECFFPFPI
jgi:predicted acyl esterase